MEKIVLVTGGAGYIVAHLVTALVAIAGEKIVEVPVSYYPRHFREGKKIRAKDGLVAIWVLLKYRISR